MRKYSWSALPGLFAHVAAPDQFATENRDAAIMDATARPETNTKG